MLRVVSPAGLTGPLLERLTAAPGVQNLVVLRAAVHRPEGDAVHFDLTEGAANPVFRELRELGLARQGSISVERVDATLTAAAPAGETGALRRETAPVWEMVEAIIRGGAVYAPSFYVLLTIAGLIGAAERGPADRRRHRGPVRSGRSGGGARGGWWAGRRASDRARPATWISGGARLRVSPGRGGDCLPAPGHHGPPCCGAGRHPASATLTCDVQVQEED
jgi:hypothetical protein